MQSNAAILTWDLQDIISRIHMHHPEVTHIYLFGSRSYKTNSLRSDIDLLAITSTPIADVLINEWLHDEYPPVDLFCSYDSVFARSVTNGSLIRYRKDNQWGYSDLFQQLDAKLLWNVKDGFSNEFSDWIQQTLNGINYQMSIIPSYAIPDFSKTIEKALQSLEASGVKSYYSGSSWSQISKSIIKQIEDGLCRPTKYAKRAKGFSFDGIRINNEYDFQNIIHFLLKPIYPDIFPEPFMIQIDGNSKNADFALSGNRIVIEAKWVDDTSKKDSVIKTIYGLTNFYIQNPNVRSLIFLVLYKKENINLDPRALEYMFSFERLTPPVYVRFITSDYTKKT